MSTTNLPSLPRPDRHTLLWGGLLCNAELLAILVYLVTLDGYVYDPTYLLVPFVWINVALWAVARTTVPADAGGRAPAAAVGVAYFGLLAYAGGLVSVGDVPAVLATGLEVNTGVPPGWGPALTYVGTGAVVALVPFKVVGYGALAYLVYATVREASGAAISGVVGLFSCVSCAWPVLGTAASAAFGSSSAVASAALAMSYELSTLVFLSAVGLLVWRPGFRG